MSTEAKMAEIRERAGNYAFSREGDALYREQAEQDVKWLLEQNEQLRAGLGYLLDLRNGLVKPDPFKWLGISKVLHG